MQSSVEIKKLIEAASYFQPTGAMIAGGALTSVFTGQPINDVDMYFKSREAFEEAVRGAYDDGLWCAETSGRAVTFVSGSSVIQLMHFEWFASPQAVFDSFDFTACMAAYDFDSKELVFSDNFLKHASQRHLSFHPGTRFPFASLLRVLKYQGRGYTIGRGDLLRIALACHRTPLNSWGDLERHVGGQYGQKVALQAEGEYSDDAAIAAIASTDFTVPRQGEDQPGTPEGLLAKVFGEPLAQAA